MAAPLPAQHHALQAPAVVSGGRLLGRCRNRCWAGCPAASFDGGTVSLLENINIVRLGDLCVSARMNDAEDVVSISLTDNGNILLSLGKKAEKNSPFTWLFSPDEAGLLTDWLLEVLHTSRQRVVSISSAQLSASTSVEGLTASWEEQKEPPQQKTQFLVAAKGRRHAKN